MRIATDLLLQSLFKTSFHFTVLTVQSAQSQSCSSLVLMIQSGVFHAFPSLRSVPTVSLITLSIRRLKNFYFPETLKYFLLLDNSVPHDVHQIGPIMSRPQTHLSHFAEDWPPDSKISNRVRLQTPIEQETATVMQ